MKQYIAGFILCISGFTTLAALADANNPLAARQAIKERKATFVLVQRSFKNMADMAQGKRAFDETLFRAEMLRLASLGSILPELFPDGSGGNGSKASASIWENKAEFTEAMDRYIKLINTGPDANNFTRQQLQLVVGNIGKECKSCHNNFKSQ